MSVSLEEQIAAVAEASLRPPAADAVEPHPVERRGDRGRGPWLVAAACLVVVLGVGAGLLLNHDRTTQGPTTQAPTTFAGPVDPAAGPSFDVVGQPAPGFTGITTDGTAISLSSLSGSWVIINFFSTWCVPCQTQTPELIALTQAHPDLKVITVAFSDDLGAVNSLLTSQGVTWPIVAVNDEAITALHVTGVPTTVVVNPEGTVTKVFEGFTGSGQLEAAAVPLTNRLQVPTVPKSQIIDWIAYTKEHTGLAIGDPCPSADAQPPVTPELVMGFAAVKNSAGVCVIGGWAPISGSDTPYGWLPFGTYDDAGNYTAPDAAPAGS